MSLPGKDGEAGWIGLDAVVAILVLAIGYAAAAGGAWVGLRAARAQVDAAAELIESRNADAESIAQGLRP